MKKCKWCGRECEDSAIICPGCGQLFSNEPPQAGTDSNGAQQPGTGPYGAPGFPPNASYPMPAKRNGFSVAALVFGICGILGLICCGPIAGILGIVFGFLGKSQIRKSNGTEEGEGLATAGIVLGICSIVLCILVNVLIVVFYPNFYSEWSSRLNQRIS